MTIAPPRKKSRAVFWIAAMVITSAILATVLLANDMRNLKALAQHYHISLFQQNVEITRKPAPTIRIKPKPAQIRLPQHAFDLSGPAVRESFIRMWNITGETVCARLTDAGFPVGAWKQSDLDAGTYECSYETQDATSADAASFFVIVRGTASGEISGMRIKVIIPDTEAGKALKDKFVAVVGRLVKESQWTDFNAALDPIGRLENVTLAAFGAKLTFFHEFEDNRRFNFILELERRTPEQRQSSGFFDKTKWLPFPPPAPVGQGTIAIR
jgi:hypothetical protein